MPKDGIVPPGDHDEAHVRPRLARQNSDVDAVELTQTDVAHHDVRRAQLDGHPGVLEAIGELHVVPGATQPPSGDRQYL